MRAISIPERLFQLLNDSLAPKVHFQDRRIAYGFTVYNNMDLLKQEPNSNVTSDDRGIGNA